MCRRRSARMRGQLCAGWLVFAGGCGAASPTSTDTRFAEIQVHEATLERAVSEGAEAETDLAREEDTEHACDRLQAARETAASAAQSVCSVAQGTHDIDATTRCERARRLAAAAPSAPASCTDTGR